jgi:predicted dithiol-disulfide oxidoreductase (DUF899 family)
MFAPTWEAGCPHCSFWADNFNGLSLHLKARDVSLVAISRAPMAKLEAFKQRLGWNFKWVSAGDSDFNYDYFVSFRPEQVAKGEIYTNYRTIQTNITDMVGISAFCKEPDGQIYHTYSAFQRGVEWINSAYRWLDLMPKGRAEPKEFPMNWVRYHDRYDGSPYYKPF